MSANAQIRAMLDELMGTARNGEDEKSLIKFDDPEVCKSFLLDCCPHEILMSTRQEIGECPLIHNLAFRADYERASKEKDYFFDLDALDHLTSFIVEADRKKEHAKGRLQDIKEEISEEIAMKADRVRTLTKEIDATLIKAEKLGADGFVQESIKMMEEIEQLRRRRFIAEKDFKEAMSETNCQQQKLKICDICGVHLGIFDNDLRLADHFGGKLHLGFIKIRETLKGFEEVEEERRAKRLKESEAREDENNNFEGNGRGHRSGSRSGQGQGRNTYVKRPDQKLYTVKGGKYTQGMSSSTLSGRSGQGQGQDTGILRTFKAKDRHGRRTVGRSRSKSSSSSENSESKSKSSRSESSSSSGSSGKSRSRSKTSSSGKSRSRSRTSSSERSRSRSRTSSSGSDKKRRDRRVRSKKRRSWKKSYSNSNSNSSSKSRSVSSGKNETKRSKENGCKKKAKEKSRPSCTSV